jgi:hypothetical protein
MNEQGSSTGVGVTGNHRLFVLTVSLAVVVMLMGLVGTLAYLWAAYKSGCDNLTPAHENAQLSPEGSSLSWWPISRRCSWVLSDGARIDVVDTSAFRTTAIVYGLTAVGTAGLATAVLWRYRVRRSHREERSQHALMFWSSLVLAVTLTGFGASVIVQTIATDLASTCDTPTALRDQRGEMERALESRTLSLWPLSVDCEWALPDGRRVTEGQTSSVVPTAFVYAVTATGLAAIPLAIAARPRGLGRRLETRGTDPGPTRIGSR